MSAHPAWCYPAHCEAALGGSHSSRTAAISRQRGSTARVQVRVWQPTATVDGRPLLELVVGDHDTGRRLRVDLTLDQAGDFNAELTSLLMHCADQSI